MAKIVLVGGGSYAWTPTLAGDLFCREALRGSHLSLVDVRPEAAVELRQYCEIMNEQLGAQWMITVDSLEDALIGAEIVCVSISTGGLEAMHYDYTVPEKYGIYHTVGDTVGPGGISRTLRNIPVFVEIAKAMERLCPNAWLVHVTNPLSQLTRAVTKATSIRAVGLCHNFSGTISMLADYLGVEYDDVDAVSVGVNHYTWMKHVTCRGQSVADKLSLEGYLSYFRQKNGELRTNTTDDVINQYLGGKNMEYYLNFALYEQLGYFPVGSSNHVAENLPFYCNDEAVLRKYSIRRKGVLPRRQQLMDGKKTDIRAVLQGEKPLPDISLSHEGLSEICEALLTGTSGRTMVSMPNEGQIANLPKDVIVETWATVSGSGISPVMSGEVPAVVAGSMLTIVNEQELAVEAALTGDRDLVYQAMYVSPLVQNKDAVKAMTDELLSCNKSYLPQFF